jgi:hypothetical protein
MWEEEEETWLAAWQKLLSMLDQRRLLDWEGAFLGVVHRAACARDPSD